jgi:hypothetical protein
VTLGERIDTKQNLSGIRLGNPNGTIDRTDRYVGALNIESIAKNDQLNDQVASRAIKWKAKTVDQAPDLTPLTSTSLLSLAAKIFVDLPVHTSCTPPASTAKDSAHTGCVHRYTLPAARLTQSYNVKLAYVAGLGDVLNRICSMSDRASQFGTA